jgi:hypothetical protein
MASTTPSGSKCKEESIRRAHLAYEALNRIYWNYFVKWVGTQEYLKTLKD